MKNKNEIEKAKEEREEYIRIFGECAYTDDWQRAIEKMEREA